jgi:hypothetical protein
MKKISKLVGILSISLLAVSPIIANNINPTTTAQAGTFSTTTTTAAIDGINETNTYKTGEQFPDFKDVIDNYNTALTYEQLTNLSLIKSILASELSQSDITQLTNDGVTFKLVGLHGTEPETDSSNFAARLEAANNNGGKVVVRLTAYDKSGNTISSKDINFVNDTIESTSVTSLSASYTDPVNVALNSSTDYVTSANSVDLSAVDQRGNKIETTTITPGKLYTSEAAAETNDGQTDVFSNDQFTFNGSVYYQPVTVSLDEKADVSSIYSNGTLLLNGTAALQGNVGKSNSITYIREIKVSDQTTQDGDWQITPTNGVVTVDNKYAALMDDSDTQTKRTLEQSTQWKTDKYRVNTATGAKEYRVSTSEWISADDVSYQGS